MTFLTEPDERSHEGKKASEAAVELVKTRENAAKPLDFVEKALDQMTFAV